MIRTLILVLTGIQIFLVSCTNVKEKSPTTIIDSSFALVLQQYIAVEYKLGKHNNSLLNRIARNDTNLISILKAEIQQEEMYKTIEDNLYSLIDEPDLSLKIDENTEIYRLTLKKSFSLTTIIIRIQNRNDSINLFSKRLIISGGNVKAGDTNVTVDSILYEKSKVISMNQWETFMKIINGAYFWDLGNNSNDICIDGTLCKLEGARNLSSLDENASKYHTVYKMCPIDGSFKNACQYLLELAGEDINEID